MGLCVAGTLCTLGFGPMPHTDASTCSRSDFTDTDNCMASWQTVLCNKQMTFCCGEENRKGGSDRGGHLKFDVSSKILDQTSIDHKKSMKK